MFISKLSPVVFLLHLTEGVPLLKVPVTRGSPWRSLTLMGREPFSRMYPLLAGGFPRVCITGGGGGPPPLLELFSGVLLLRVNVGESQNV